MSKIRWLLLSLVIAIVLLLPVPALGWAKSSTTREITVHARSFEYTPRTIRVQRGDHVKLTLVADDVTHGLLLESYGLKTEASPHQEEESSIEFVADRTGKFRMRCTTVCGPLHPFMVGEFIVQPTYNLPIALALTLVAAFGTVGLVAWRGAGPTDDLLSGWRFELTRFGWVKSLLKQRWFQYALILPNLFFFTIIMLAAFFGTPVGNANFAIIFVWIVWWAALKLFLIPIGGRLWCAMCPLPAPGEWIDHRSVIRKGLEKPLSLARKLWPRRFRNIWLQNASFLGVALFSAIILTRPLATGVVLLGFIIAAFITSWIYGRRVFCRYICPVSGFTGMYSMVAPVEIRVKDPAICASHPEKECIQGSAHGYGCPWLEYPGNLERNAYCGMCTECLKTCPKDNIAVNIRPFGRDLFVVGGRGIDEIYNVFIMLTCAIIYIAVYLGPWGWLKDLANIATIPGFLLYAMFFFLANLVLLPGLFYVAVWLGKGLAEGKLPPARETFAFIGVLKDRLAALLRRQPMPRPARKPNVRLGNPGLPATQRLFVDYSYALIPLGLAAWIGFTVSFVLIDISYAIPLLSDPFGWGWDLLGTAGYPWTLYAPRLVPYLQMPIMLVGLTVSIYTAYRIATHHITDREQVLRSLTPAFIFIVAVTAVVFRLFM